MRSPLTDMHCKTSILLLCIQAVLCVTGTSGVSAQTDAEDKVHLQELVKADWTEADRLFAARRARASGLPASKINHLGVTTTQDAAGGCDGIKNGRFGFHVAVGEKDPWWQVDLEKDHLLDRIVIHNRTDGTLAARTKNLVIQIACNAAPEKFHTVYRHNGKVFYGEKQKKPLVVQLRGKEITARIVRVFVAGICHLALDEIEVFPADHPERNIALNKPADQKSVSRHSFPGTAGENASPVDGGFLLAHTREIIKRGHELSTRLHAESDPRLLASFRENLEELSRQTNKLEASGDAPESPRKSIYFKARRLLRRIAFTNPLLDFDRILFIKRRHPYYQHICDQYYGFTSIAGGGLFILSDPFGKHPELIDVLEQSRVENGRFKGRKLVPGSFLSPELSYDGKEILFAYTENTDPETSWRQAEKHRRWTTTNCYHLFKVRSDGTHLMQLSDGPWNDFDPCFLPNGRIVFISERRGGFVRCGTRACRSYNLCSMEPDGTGITVLSYHDTNEWHPSVNNDGMIVYTRWDYIDRDTQAAHHLWTCSPDGRDPRAPHGNYPERLADRPWVELDIRAVPGSRKYIAVAAPHHGHAFGSLIHIDLRIEDDNKNSQITRLTPEVPFPEGEASIRTSMVYGTPWPLDEDDFLCVYDSSAKNHGIYWADRFGNRELLYRDPALPCFSPIPLRARPMPPVLRDYTTHKPSGSDANATTQRSKIAVLNIYDSDFTWPEQVTISALRILQILPKSVPRRNTPKIGVAEQSNARAVLGTVPVEPDGSAYFEAPAGRLLYFQALDENGMAVQSMRTATYAHPGELLVCQGCHESKHGTPKMTGAFPQALHRPPSRIQPDADGSNPFNYVRLVQPVLDRNCVECHKRKKAIDLTGTLEHVRDRDGRNRPFTRSYNNLAGKYGFWYQTLINSLTMTGLHGGSRVIPGRFGARASRLLDYINGNHYGVALSSDDFHRITLWLDCNSEFLGAYEDPEAQAHGKPVQPSLH